MKERNLAWHTPSSLCRAAQVLAASKSDLEDLRCALHQWSPTARGILLAGELIGVRRRGVIIWLRWDTNAATGLVEADPAEAERRHVLYVRLPPQPEAGEASPLRRRVSDGDPWQDGSAPDGAASGRVVVEVSRGRLSE